MASSRGLHSSNRSTSSAVKRHNFMVSTGQAPTPNERLSIPFPTRSSCRTLRLENGEIMALRFLTAGVGMLLGASGALMYAASWQRWAGACRWGDAESGLCLSRQDHLYDFLAPSAPWEPVGNAAQLAGWSLLVLALAFALLPWALTGRRPGIFSAIALVGAVLALCAVGVATLRSGLAGSVVHPITGSLALYVWLFVPPVLLVRFAVAARGWSLAAAVWLVLATPLVAAFSYAVGPYDAQPLWEGISGLLTVSAGLCLLGAAAFGSRPRTQGSADTVSASRSHRPEGAVSALGPSLEKD